MALEHAAQLPGCAVMQGPIPLPVSFRSMIYFYSITNLQSNIKRLHPGILMESDEPSQTNPVIYAAAIIMLSSYVAHRLCEPFSILDLAREQVK